MTAHYCVDCASLIGPITVHTEIECLRTQVTKLKGDRDAWKDAWFAQREATGRVAWQWEALWHPAQREQT